VRAADGVEPPAVFGDAVGETRLLREGRVGAVAPAVGKPVVVDARPLENAAQRGLRLRELARAAQARGEGRVNRRAALGEVVREGAPQAEVVRDRGAVRLERLVRAAAFDGDGVAGAADAEVEAVRPAPAVAQRVEVEAAAPQLVSEGLEVADVAARALVVVGGGAVDALADGAEVGPAEAGRREVVVRSGALVRAVAEDFEPVEGAKENSAR
jgi:hypothetical protein